MAVRHAGARPAVGRGRAEGDREGRLMSGGYLSKGRAHGEASSKQTGSTRSDG
jgi:hypothetical protein